MRLSSMKLHVIGVVLAVCALLGAGGQGMAGEPKRSGWYVGAGAGVNWTSEMKQAGWNLDTLCYPDSDCRHVGGAPEGYRWFYDIDSDPGSTFEISVGRMFGNVRVELSASQRDNDIEEEFTGITYLDGSGIVPKDGNYESSATRSVDDLTTRTLSLNAYYDFPLPESPIVPYLGAGLGLSFVDLSGLYFNIQYSCKDPASDCERPERYNSRQDVDLTDTVLSKHLYAGADYHLDDRFLLGLKLSYSLVDDMEDRDSYSEHPVPDLTSLTEIEDMKHWSLMFGLKYRLGG